MRFAAIGDMLSFRRSIPMKETNIKNAKTAVTITTALTFFAAGFEVIMAFMGSKPGMNIFDIASFAMANPNVYCLILILVNIILLPSAILLYRQNGISLKKEIAEKKTLGRDILFGLAALAASLMVSLGYAFVFAAGRTELAFVDTDTSVGTTVIKIIALVFVSGICKEIYFRGFAKRFAGTVLGKTNALLLFNLMFAMLDWYNFGFSLIVGIIWIWAYKKSRHMISSMIAHGGTNLAGIIWLLVMSGVN